MGTVAHNNKSVRNVILCTIAHEGLIEEEEEVKTHDERMNPHPNMLGKQMFC